MLLSFIPIQVVLYNGELQGQTSPGFSWLVFDPIYDDWSISPRSSSSKDYTFTDDDVKKVGQLI